MKAEPWPAGDNGRAGDAGQAQRDAVDLAAPGQVRDEDLGHALVRAAARVGLRGAGFVDERRSHRGTAVNRDRAREHDPRRARGRAIGQPMQQGERCEQVHAQTEQGLALRQAARHAREVEHDVGRGQARHAEPALPATFDTVPEPTIVPAEAPGACGMGHPFAEAKIHLGAVHLGAVQFDAQAQVDAPIAPGVARFVRRDRGRCERGRRLRSRRRAGLRGRGAFRGGNSRCRGRPCGPPGSAPCCRPRRSSARCTRTALPSSLRRQRWRVGEHLVLEVDGEVDEASWHGVRFRRRAAADHKVLPGHEGAGNAGEHDRDCGHFGRFAAAA